MEVILVTLLPLCTRVNDFPDKSVTWPFMTRMVELGGGSRTIRLVVMGFAAILDDATVRRSPFLMSLNVIDFFAGMKVISGVVAVRRTFRWWPLFRVIVS